MHETLQKNDEFSLFFSKKIQSTPINCARRGALAHNLNICDTYKTGVRMKKIVTVIVCVVFLALSGCVSAKSVWLSNYSEAQELAEKNNKKIFLLFSSVETDEASAALRKNVFDAKEFRKALNEYILVNLDFSESRYAAIEVAEDADEQTLAAAALAQELLMQDADLAQKYAVQGLPTAYLLTKEGYVLAAIEIPPEITTLKEVIALLDKKKESAGKIEAIINRIDSSADVIDKALAINDLYEETEVQFRDLLFGFFTKISEFDPDNTTGLLGKFTVQIAYHNVMDYLATGDIDSAVLEFVTVAENPLLSPDEKQQVLYTAAYFMAQSGYGNIDTVLNFLADAYDASPESEMASGIISIIEELKEQQAATAGGE
jgi:thioredoxin-related protein